MTMRDFPKPHSYRALGEPTGLLEIGLKTLRWSTENQIAREGHFRPVGSNGFGNGGKPALFDQQPVEAHAMICACLKPTKPQAIAFGSRRLTRPSSGSTAEMTWDSLSMTLQSGGCRDGLHIDRVEPERRRGVDRSPSCCRSPRCTGTQDAMSAAEQVTLAS